LSLRLSDAWNFTGKNTRGSPAARHHGTTASRTPSRGHVPRDAVRKSRPVEPHQRGQPQRHRPPCPRSWPAYKGSAPGAASSSAKPCPSYANMSARGGRHHPRPRSRQRHPEPPRRGSQPHRKTNRALRRALRGWRARSAADASSRAAGFPQIFQRLRVSSGCVNGTAVRAKGGCASVRRPIRARRPLVEAGTAARMPP